MFHETTLSVSCKRNYSSGSLGICRAHIVCVQYISIYISIYIYSIVLCNSQKGLCGVAWHTLYNNICSACMQRADCNNRNSLYLPSSLLSRDTRTIQWLHAAQPHAHLTAAVSTGRFLNLNIENPSRHCISKSGRPTQMTWPFQPMSCFALNDFLH